MGDPLFGNVKLGAFLCKISLGFFFFTKREEVMFHESEKRKDQERSFHYFLTLSSWGGPNINKVIVNL